jgi:hypothetical protein
MSDRSGPECRCQCNACRSTCRAGGRLAEVEVAAARKWHPEMGGGEMPRPAETWDDVIDGMIRSAPAGLRGPMRSWRGRV